MKANITNNLIPQLKTQSKPYDVRDEKLVGFLIRVNPTGKMTYMCEYGRGKRIMMGKVGVLTPMQARDKTKEMLADAIKGHDHNEVKKQINKIPTFKSFLENDYAPWHEAHAKQGKQDIDRIKRHFLEEFGDKKLINIDIRSVEKWCTRRLNEGVKPATINRDITALKSLFSKALKWELITNRPLVNLKPYKVDQHGKIRYLSKEEEARLRATLDDRQEKLKKTRMSYNEWLKTRDKPALPDLSDKIFVDHVKPMVLVSVNTGLRRGELLSLDWENIDFPNSTLTVTGDTAKSSMTRHIPLNSEVLQILKNWRKQNPTPGLVFQNKNENKFSNLRKAWHNLLATAKIQNFRWHDMRHHFASRLVMAGVDLNTVRELLGHSDIKMTLRYAHLAPEHKALAVEKLIV